MDNIERLLLAMSTTEIAMLLFLAFVVLAYFARRIMLAIEARAWREIRGQWPPKE